MIDYFITKSNGNSMHTENGPNEPHELFEVRSSSNKKNRFLHKIYKYSPYFPRNKLVNLIYNDDSPDKANQAPYDFSYKNHMNLNCLSIALKGFCQSSK